MGQPEGAHELPAAYTAHPNINSAVTPNDGVANSVISVLKTLQIPPKTFPTTGQDATLDGLQNILAGYQCMTVYKPIYHEAQAAAALALYLRAGKKPPAGLVNGKSNNNKTDVPSVAADTRSPSTTANMKSTVVKDQFVSPSDLCSRLAGERLHGSRHPVTATAPAERARRCSSSAARTSGSARSARPPRGRPRGPGRAGHRARRRQRCREVGADQHDVRHPSLPTVVRSSGKATRNASARRVTRPRSGIETVYQDLALADNLDIVQNMFLGRERTRLALLDEEGMETVGRGDAERACR